jgi:LysM repeat protein
MGLPSLGGLPRVAIWALILLLVALFLFLFGPGLLGFGDDDQGIGGASPTPAATEEPTEELVPTEPPVPTPQVYVVVRNDTMNKIAKKHGLTLDELMAANPKIKNPNNIDIGDEIIIPVPVADDTTEDGTVEGEETPAP